MDEAAELQANSLVMVVGASPQVPVPDARVMVADGISALVSYAPERGVRIGREPLHPSGIEVMAQSCLIANL